jgi:hypothetical protein
VLDAACRFSGERLAGSPHGVDSQRLPCMNVDDQPHVQVAIIGAGFAGLAMAI